jgi:anion-transporting  ArsA/GET3 family ATPase
MAMEKLFELHATGQWDVLVLDTPPSRNALDFLDAPRRLTQFIEGRGMQMFMKPTGFATRVVGRGSSMALGVLKKIIGIDLISDLAEFFEAFSGMVGGFRERAKRVTELLGAKETTFVIVCGPQGDPIDEAVYFHRKLVEAKMPVGGVIVNKVHYAFDGEDSGELRKEVKKAVSDDDLAGRVVANFDDFKALAERDAANIEHLARELKQKHVIRVPYLDEDVHDLAGLLEINRYLFAASAEQREAIEAGVA